MHSFYDSIGDYLTVAAPARTLIVEDEDMSRERVHALLKRTSEVEIVGVCADGVEALRAIQVEAPELLFLDVELPELDGLAVLEALEPERCPEVVFVTAHEKYLQRAFEVHALDYLRKPFTEERFYDALRHACRRVLQERLGHANATHDRVLTVLRELRAQSHSARDRLVIQDKAADMYHVIPSEDIDWIEAKDGGVLIHAGKQHYFARQSFAEVERQLEPDLFLRIHRSRIVNRTRVAAVKRLWRGEYSMILTNGKSLGTCRTYHRAVKAYLAWM